MKSFLLPLAAALALLSAPAAAQNASIRWGEIPREELFATHFPEAPYAEAVVLFDQAIARVDEKNRLKYLRHHRTKIFSANATDRGIVRIPYGPNDEIKGFRAHTIVPPGHLVEVDGDHRHEEKLPDGSKVLVVEFPSLQPGVVIEYEYELRRDELHTIPIWSFRSRDFTRRSRFAMMIPPGMTYDATFPWVPRLTPRPEVRMINDPEKPSREVQQVAWELTNQPPVSPVPMAGDPEQYRLSLYVQLGEFRSTYENFTIRRPWNTVGEEVARRYESFAKDDGGLKELAATAGASGTGAAAASALYRLVRDQIRTDDTGPDVTGTIGQVVREGRGTARAKNLLLVHLLREQGLGADPVLIRSASHGPIQPKYHGAAQFDHVIVRTDIDGKTVWLDASQRGCPFGLLPPDAQASSGLQVASGGQSDLVDVSAPAVTSGREVLTEASFDGNGTLHATCRIRYDGWDALAPRTAAALDGGQQLAEAVVRSRFGDSAAVKSFTVDPLENADAPLNLTVTFSVPDYADVTGQELRLKLPYLSAMDENPLPEGERELPVFLGFAGTRHEQLKLTVPDGWTLPAAPSRGSARNGDLRFKTTHELEGAALSSSRTVRIIEPVVSHDDAAALHGIFDEMVATDTSELVLQKQGTRSSSAR